MTDKDPTRRVTTGKHREPKTVADVLLQLRRAVKNAKRLTAEDQAFLRRWLSEQW